MSYQRMTSHIWDIIHYVCVWRDTEVVVVWITHYLRVLSRAWSRNFCSTACTKTQEIFFFKWENTLNLGTDTKVCVSLCICVLAYEFLPAQQTKSIAYDPNSVIFKACLCVWSKCTVIKHWETPPRPSLLSLQTQEGRKRK